MKSPLQLRPGEYFETAPRRVAARIRVVVYEPGDAGRVVVVPNTAGTFQCLVAGFFMVLYDVAARAHVYFCDEGLSLGLERNRRFGGCDVMGTAVFAKLDRLGNTVGLDERDVKRIRALYG